MTKEQIEHLFDKSKVKANKGNEADEPVDFDEEKIHLDDDKPVNEQPSGDKHYFFNMGMITQEWWEHPDGSVTVKVRAQCTACRGSLVLLNFGDFSGQDTRTKSIYKYVMTSRQRTIPPE